MVCDEVGGKTQRHPDFGGGEVAQRETVDDPQARWVTQRGVLRRARLHLISSFSVHCFNLD